MMTNWITSMHFISQLLACSLGVAGALWIGTLFSVSWLSGCATMMADGPEIGRVAVSLFRRWTVPSLLVCLMAGLALLSEIQLRHASLPRGDWPYAIALVAIPLLALHVTVGKRAKWVARGHIDAVRGEGMRRLALVLSLGAVVALATLRAAWIP
jgi:hypothetical protein